MSFPKESIELQNLLNRELSMRLELDDFDPDYPNAASAEYRDYFIRGAEMAGLREIPPHILSWAINRAIQNGVTSQRAGVVFADVYFKVQIKPDYRDAQRRNGILKREAFLLSEYEKALNGSGCKDRA